MKMLIKIASIIAISILLFVPKLVNAQEDQAGSIKVHSNLILDNAGGDNFKDTVNYRGFGFGHGLDSVPATRDSSFIPMVIPSIFAGKELREIGLSSMVAGDRNVVVYIRRVRSGTRTTMATVTFSSDTDLSYTTTSGINTSYDDLAVGDIVYPVDTSSAGTNFRRGLGVVLMFK